MDAFQELNEILNSDFTRTGVVIGASQFSTNRKEFAHKNVYAVFGQAHSVISGRIAYVFNIQGPCLSIDTACSSSLVALHTLSNLITIGDCVKGIFGATNSLDCYPTTAALKTLGMLSPDGRCKTLDTRADGYVRCEHTRIMYLHHKCASSDIKLCPIISCSSNINQDGRCSTLAAPNGVSQTLLLKYAMDSSLSAVKTYHLQMHGTGTALGDPIEFNAVFDSLIEVVDFLCLSASKSLMGHGEAAAGMVSIDSLISKIMHCRTAPILHLRKLNDFIVNDMHGHHTQSLTVHISRQLSASPLEFHAQTQTLASGASAFAFQGTNAHAMFISSAETPPSVALRSLSFMFLRRSECRTAACICLNQLQTNLIVFCARIDSTYYKDHTIHGKLLCPAVLMFAIPLLFKSHITDATSRHMLTALSIMSPLEISDGKYAFEVRTFFTGAGEIRIQTTGLSILKYTNHASRCYKFRSSRYAWRALSKQKNQGMITALG